MKGIAKKNEFFQCAQVLRVDRCLKKRLQNPGDIFSHYGFFSDRWPAVAGYPIAVKVIV